MKRMLTFFSLMILLFSLLLTPINAFAENFNVIESNNLDNSSKLNGNSEKSKNSGMNYQDLYESKNEIEDTDSKCSTTLEQKLNSNVIDNTKISGRDVSNKIDVTDKKISINGVEYAQGSDVVAGDTFRMDIYWNLLNTEGVSANDYFIVPLNIKGIDLSTDLEIPVFISDSGSSVDIGTYVIIKDAENNFFIKCTLNEKINDYSSLTNGQFYTVATLEKGKIEIEMNDNQKIEIIVNESDGKEPVESITPFDPEGLGKWGWQNTPDSNHLTWQMGVNRKQFFNVLTGKITDVSNLRSQNILLVDELQNGQTFLSENNLTIKFEWPLVVEQNGELKGADPAFNSCYLNDSTPMVRINYNSGETAEQFKERIKNSTGPCYGVFPKEEHTLEAKANNAGDYLYFNMGNMVDSLLSTNTKEQILESISNTSYSDEIKETTKEAYTRYFSALDIKDNEFVPGMGCIMLFTTEVQYGTATQEIHNKAYTESGDIGEATLKYTDYGGKVSGVEKGNVRITKINKDTLQLLPNIEFSLYKRVGSSRQLIDRKVTDETGVVEFKKIPIGNFEIVESKAENYNPASLEVVNYKNETIPIKDIIIDNIIYKGFEFSFTGSETQGLFFKATNKIKSTKISVQANKVLTGKTLTAGAYSFELKDSDEKVLQIKTNDATGAINFDDLSYDKAGTYEYTIQEVEGSQAGVTYDKHKIKAVVTVEDKDGKLEASVVYTGDQTFKNSYSFQKNITNSTKKNRLPGTGEKKSSLFIITGLLIVLLIYIFEKYKKKI